MFPVTPDENIDICVFDPPVDCIVLLDPNELVAVIFIITPCEFDITGVAPGAPDGTGLPAEFVKAGVAPGSVDATVWFWLFV